MCFVKSNFKHILTKSRFVWLFFLNPEYTLFFRDVSIRMGVISVLNAPGQESVSVSERCSCIGALPNMKGILIWIVYSCPTASVHRTVQKCVKTPPVFLLIPSGPSRMIVCMFIVLDDSTELIIVVFMFSLNTKF